MSARLPGMAGLALAAAGAGLAQVPGSASASAMVLVRVEEPAARGFAMSRGAGLDVPTTGVLEAEVDLGAPAADGGNASATDNGKGGEGGSGAPASPGRLVHLRPLAFKLEGKRDAAFAVLLPPDDTCVLTAPGASLPVQGFRFSLGGKGAADPFGLTFDGQGQQDFKVGGTLRVTDGLPRLRFSGHFDVTVTYN